jgi:hypothetical protein
MAAVDHEKIGAAGASFSRKLLDILFPVSFCFQQVGHTQIQEIITSSLKHFIFTDARKDSFLRSKV